MRNLQLLILSSTLLLLATFSSAWPWPPYDVLKRDDTSTSPGSGSSSATSAASTTAGTDTSATAKGSKTGSGSASGTITGSGSSSPTGSNSTKSAKSKTTEIDPRVPAGGIQMLTPSALAAPSYYKIGEFVTFGWNYTSLSVSPTAVDIVASCQRNDQVYTIAMNQSLNGTQAVTWDTGAYQSTATVPLLTETYTLVVYDVDKGISATASPGYFGVFNQFTFGMYTPKPYTPLN
ncbi:hypothetical protein FGG08_007126, partial [Glutinoglossum americanum]